MILKNILKVVNNPYQKIQKNKLNYYHKQLNLFQKERAREFNFL
jgi:hypothetical protein